MFRAYPLNLSKCPRCYVAQREDASFVILGAARVRIEAAGGLASNFLQIDDTDYGSIGHSSITSIVTLHFGLGTVEDDDQDYRTEERVLSQAIPHWRNALRSLETAPARTAGGEVTIAAHVTDLEYECPSGCGFTMTMDNELFGSYKKEED